MNATGTSWSSVSRVPIDTTNSGIDHFIPGLAVNKATSGTTAQLGLTYYYYPAGTTQLSVGSVSSSNAGSTWTPAQTVQTAMSPAWAANTSQGRMVGDYISTSYGSDNLPHGVFGSALTPTTGSSTSCTTSALDNCNAPISASSAVATAGTVASSSDPTVFSGNGGADASSLWNVVANNGSKHRD
jgi:hypothetical protein